MRNLTSPYLIGLKGLLFLVLGLSASALLFHERPAARVAFLLVVSIWGFCRFYYFAFYVIQNYIDPLYRFTGLISFVRYVVAKPR